MKPIHICVPVLRRYDLLRDLLISLAKGTVKPSMVHIVDNGRDRERLFMACGSYEGAVDIWTPETPLGLSETWNWFIDNVPEERLITNDDIVFGPESVEAMANTPGELVTALLGTNAFSCFLLRDICVETVGRFDEGISPNYAYFEDCDYVMRMELAGLPLTGVECGVEHKGSQTLAAASSAQVVEHNRKFLVAQTNYINKWGHLPQGIERQL